MLNAERTENQRNVFDFLIEHFKSQAPFRKDDLQKVTDWRGASFPTYWSKQYKQFFISAGADSFRVSDAFRPYAKWEAFQRHVTQVRRVSSDYTLLRHDAVLIFEFFMPLTNETHLRTALDALFYEDTILSRLKALNRNKLNRQFPPLGTESEDHYFGRLCDWLATRFQGYSVSTVSGRFRAQELMSIPEAARIEENGDRYLIDETTAIVRFIFPCGTPVRRHVGTADEFEDPDPDPSDRSGPEEAKRIRWFFNALFVQSIIQVVNGEAEIWMVESGLRNRLHIWRVEP
jgi:hypothetical protein